MTIQQQLKNFLQDSPKPLVVILGPTASGKTNLSLQLAKTHNGEILNADSRQIYQEMPISTDVSQDLQGIPHHLLEITKPDQSITLAQYKDLALKKITKIHQRQAIPILVGGTGLYISAICENYQMPRIPPNPELRAELEKEAAEKGPESLHQKLAQLDPEAANAIHPNNVRYVIRALEVNLSEAKIVEQPTTDFQVFKIGISWPRELIYQRIEKRVDQQIERGLVDEVRSLLDKGYAENLPAMSSLGVKEIIPFINGQQTLEQCVEILKRNTRRYAKRQLTWFRRDDDIHWIDYLDIANHPHIP